VGRQPAWACFLMFFHLEVDYYGIKVQNNIKLPFRLIQFLRRLVALKMNYIL